LQDVAHWISSSTNSALRAAAVGTAVLTLTVWLAKTLSIGVASKSIIALPANATTTVVATVLLAAILQALAGTGIKEGLAKSKTLLLEARPLRLPVIFALGNDTPEDLLDKVSDTDGQTDQALIDAI